MSENLEQRLVDLLRTRLDVLRQALEDEDGNWAVRGFADVWNTVYPMTSDTKVLSKVIEVLLVPVFLDSIKGLGMKVEFAAHQNHYPDLTIIDEATKARVAIDLKSTYFTSADRVNGFTLGAFTGYFRERGSSKNTTYPYGSYEAHLVLGVLYHKLTESDDQRRYPLDQIRDIEPVVGKFRFILQPKWAIATARPGSGNTKNIGSVQEVDRLVNGTGPFTQFRNPEAVFDDYWTNYLTADMARSAGTVVPFKNLREYVAWRTPPQLDLHGQQISDE